MSHNNAISHKDDSARIEVPDAPAIPGLTFRYFRGEVDYPAIATVNRKSIKADQIAYKSSVEEIAPGYSNLYNCDPYKDMLFIEIDGKVIGYSRVWWEKKPNGTRIYVHLARLLPEWRGKGIRRPCYGSTNAGRERLQQNIHQMPRAFLNADSLIQRLTGNLF